MHLKEIILDGFKTYKKRTVIQGFDREFNAITGHNGSGKSNVLDGICFVLGIDVKMARVENLKGLIYKQGQAGVDRASVTLVFENTDSSQSPIGYEHMEQISVCRQIGVGGKSGYRINGSNAEVGRVKTLFHSVQLNVNNPHFLIMQGRIMQVINMKPAETLSMLEEAAGTSLFENKKYHALQTIKKKDAELENCERVMKEEITPRLQKLSNERTAYLDFNKQTTEVESKSRIVQAYDYVKATEGIAKCEKEQEADVQAKESWTTKISEADAEEKELQRRHKEETNARKQKESGNALVACEAAEQEASKKLVKADAELKSLEKGLKEDEKAAKTIDADIKKIEDAQRKAETEMDKAKAKAEEESAKAEAAEKEAAAKKSEYEASMGLASSSKDGVKNLQGQLSDAKDAVRKLETELQTSEMAKKQFAKELKEAEKKLAEARKSGGQQEKDHKKLVDEVAELQKQMESLGHDEAAEKGLRKQEKELGDEAKGLRRQEGQLPGSGGSIDFHYSDPEKNFDRSRVKGTVASNLKVKDEAHHTALEALAGGRLLQVIVDTNTTGMLLLDKGQLQRRVTLIPLNKIQPRPITAAKVAEAQKLVGGADKATLAVDLLEFDAVVAPAMQNIFGTTIVCNDDAAARKICEQLNIKTVTLAGDLYDPSGSLTGGHRGASGSLLARAGLRRQMADVESKLGGVKAQLEQLHAAASKLGELQSRYEVKQHELSIQKEKLANTEVGERAASVEALQAKLAEAGEAWTGAGEQLKEQKELLEKLEAQVKDFEGDREASMKRMKAAIASAEKEAKEAQKAQKTAQVTEAKAAAALEELTKELEAAVEKKASLGQGQAKANEDIAAKDASVQKLRAAYEAAQAALQACQEEMGQHDAELQRIAARREELQQLREDGQLELSKVENNLKRFAEKMAGAKAAVKHLLKANPWMESEKASFGVAGGEYDFAKKNVEKLRKELDALQGKLELAGKKINRKVLTEYETTEREYADLMSKKDIVEKDKETLNAVIDELVQKKIEALNKAWAKVNGDFGSILTTLLPGNVAKLEPKPGCPVEEGLIIKVGLGEEGSGSILWKAGLNDLSGGQKSLIALSLVLALLRFKPAPIYILDEVDSALDVQHTQNIGKMIKNYFKQSQFLIVSLKDGMFSNANVIFRVHLDEDLGSQIRRYASNEATAAAALPAPKAAAGGGKKRGALTAKN